MRDFGLYLGADTKGGMLGKARACGYAAASLGHTPAAPVEWEEMGGSGRAGEQAARDGLGTAGTAELKEDRTISESRALSAALPFWP